MTIATGDYQTYTWDHRNRLIQVDFNDSADVLQKTVRYTYDAFDRRVLTEVDADADGVFEEFQRSIWNGSHVSLILDETSTVEHRFLHGPAIDMVLADESATDGLLWYLTDHQNTVRDVIDNTGTVLNRIDYTSFGEILTETDNTYTPYFAYTGRELDQHTGLQYNRARWYDPRTGRWMSEDPIRWAAGDTNLQRYVTNSPVNATDPSGLETYSSPTRAGVLTGGATIQSQAEIRAAEVAAAAAVAAQRANWEASLTAPVSQRERQPPTMRAFDGNIVGSAWDAEEGDLITPSSENAFIINSRRAGDSDFMIFLALKFMPAHVNPHIRNFDNCVMIAVGGAFPYGGGRNAVIYESKYPDLSGPAQPILVNRERGQVSFFGAFREDCSRHVS